MIVIIFGDTIKCVSKLLLKLIIEYYQIYETKSI